MKIQRSLSQSTLYNHHNVFTFRLLLSAGREGEAWEPPNKMILFLKTHNKVSLIFPMTIRFQLLFYYTFYFFHSLTLLLSVYLPLIFFVFYMVRAVL
jgi:hypothetical protein